MMWNNDHVMLNGFIYDKHVSNVPHMIRNERMILTNSVSLYRVLQIQVREKRIEVSLL